jgi:cytochrome c oxidase subunit 2
MKKFNRSRVFALAGLAVAGVALTTFAAVTTDGAERGRADSRRDERSVGGQGQVREFTVTGRDNRFAPGRIEVQKDDLIKITFTAADIAHSFTVDSYRIAKRAGAGQTVVFEFRADQTGSFPYYCNLSQDDKCKQMKGELVVR